MTFRLQEMKCPQSIATTVTIYYYDISTLWHFTTVTLHPPPPFYTSRKLTSTPPQSWTFCHCVRTSSFFYLDCESKSTFALKQNVDIWPDDGTQWCRDQLGMCPYLTQPIVWWGTPNRTLSLHGSAGRVPWPSLTLTPYVPINDMAN